MAEHLYRSRFAGVVCLALFLGTASLAGSRNASSADAKDVSPGQVRLNSQSTPPRAAGRLPVPFREREPIPRSAESAAAAVPSAAPVRRIGAVKGSQHDLAIQEVQVADGAVVPGATIRITGKVVNLGSWPETNVPLVCKLWDRIPIEPARLMSVGPRMEKEFSYTWTVPAYAPAPDSVVPVYLLVCSVGPVEGEDDVTNNIETLKLVPDQQISGFQPQHAIDVGQEVHQWIAYQGYRYYADQITGADIANYLGTWDNAQGDDRSTFLEGTAAEDKGNRPPLYQSCPFAGYPTCPYYRHFCAGADGSEIYSGLWGYDSALEQANRIWPYAVDAYGTNKALAFYYLGHVAHLLADMTVPAHTHNDEHPIWDSYEYTIAEQHNFQLWFFNGGRSGDWAQELTLFADLYSLFYRTANYTEDYDSNDVNGDGPPYYYPSDYVSTWHRPQDVDNAGADIDVNEVTIIGDDLMPYAMKRTAELIRLFYSQVDTSDPIVSLTYPTSENPDNPTLRNTRSSFNLTASASDPESGVLQKGFRYMWSYWTGNDWSAWADVLPSPTTDPISFPPAQGETLYAFQVYGENGGGRLASSSIKYLRIVNNPPSTPVLSSPADGATGLGLAPALQASAFFDPDGDTHANSQWQVDDNGNFSSPEWDSGESYTPSTQTTIPPGLLSYGISYYWHVRYKDNRGAWSDWSASWSFTTLADTDGDGVPDPNDDCPNTIPGMAGRVGADGCPAPVIGDFDRDGDVDQVDRDAFESCASGPGYGFAIDCDDRDFDSDADVDQADFAVFQRCLSGPDVPADPNCAE